MPSLDLDHLTPGPWHTLTIGGPHFRSLLTHPDDCPNHRCHLGRIFGTLDKGLTDGEYKVRASKLGVEYRHADLSAVDGRPVRLDPLPLDEATADYLADVANEAVNAYHHADQCHCDTWPTVCASGYQPGTWDTGAWYAALPALLAAWEQRRGEQPRVMTVWVDEASTLGDVDRDAAQDVLRRSLAAHPAQPQPAKPERVVMPHDQAEYDRMRDSDRKPADCPQCPTAGPVNHWPMFSYCRGGNGPGKPIRPHCTCDSCF